MNYEEHFLSLSTADIREIASFRREDIDTPGEVISTKIIQMCIKTLNSDHITSEEQALGHFTRKILKKLST